MVVGRAHIGDNDLYDKATDYSALVNKYLGKGGWPSSGKILIQSNYPILTMI